MFRMVNGNSMGNKSNLLSLLVARLLSRLNQIEVDTMIYVAVGARISCVVVVMIVVVT